MMLQVLFPLLQLSAEQPPASSDNGAQVKNCSASPSSSLAHWSEANDLVINDNHASDSLTMHTLFPTTVATTRCTDGTLLQELKEWIDTEVATMHRGRPPQPYVNNDEFYSWQTREQAPLGVEHALPAASTVADPMHRLRRLAREQCTRYLSSGMAGGDEAEMAAYRRHLGTRELIAWAAKYDGKHDRGHAEHDHGDAICSGVLYLRMPPRAPPLIFSDPRLVGRRLAYAASGGYEHAGENTDEWVAEKATHEAPSAGQRGRADGAVDSPEASPVAARRRERQRQAEWMRKQARQLEAIGSSVDMAFASAPVPRGPFATRALLSAREGDMVLFPPWLFHSVPSQWQPRVSVPAQEGDSSRDDASHGGERIVIAFNLLQVATAA